MPDDLTKPAPAPVSHELTVADGGAVSRPSPAMEMWASFERMAKDPDIDPEKIRALASIQGDVLDRAASDAFTAAKAAAMQEMPRITKDSVIAHPGKNGAPDRIVGRYIKYESLRRIIDPILNRHGLFLSHRTGSAGNMMTVEAVLSFSRDGMAWTEAGGPMALPLDTSGAKNNTQGAGSALSYGYRYTTCAILGIFVENEDDDGNGAGTRAIAPPADWQEELLHESRLKAAEGMSAYKAWYQGLSGMKRGWLSDEGHHDANKARADAADEQ